jgi:hypothetical protein
MGKNIRRKQYGISKHLYLYCLIKNLLWEIIRKNSLREKSTIFMIWRSSRVIIREFTPPDLYKSQSCLIPIPWHSYGKQNWVIKDIVNKSVRFSQDLFAKTICLLWESLFTSNLLCNIVLYITHMHLSNTSAHYLDRYGKWFCWILTTLF